MKVVVVQRIVHKLGTAELRVDFNLRIRPGSGNVWVRSPVPIRKTPDLCRRNEKCMGRGISNVGCKNFRKVGCKALFVESEVRTMPSGKCDVYY
jgi:hypothetical protein